MLKSVYRIGIRQVLSNRFEWDVNVKVLIWFSAIFLSFGIWFHCLLLYLVLFVEYKHIKRYMTKVVFNALNFYAIMLVTVKTLQGYIYPPHVWTILLKCGMNSRWGTYKLNSKSANTANSWLRTSLEVTYSSAEIA